MMKKFQLFILLLVIMLLLALADYQVNIPQGLTLPSSPTENNSNTPGVAPVVHPDPNLTQQILDSSPELSSHHLEKRTRSVELFETFDLSRMTNIVVYKNVVLDKAEANTFPLYIYEIQGEAGKGKINFLNLKLAMVKQLGSSENINETNQYGQASFFYNDPLNANTGFLMVQIKDNLFGFKYFKTSERIFQNIQSFISSQAI